jgi:hypothetical protein
VNGLAKLLAIEALEKYYGNEKGVVTKAIDTVSIEMTPLQKPTEKTRLFQFGQVFSK